MDIVKIVNVHKPEELKKWAQQLQTQPLSEALVDIGVFINALKDQLTDKSDFFTAIETVRPLIHQLNPLIKKQAGEREARDYIELLALEAAAYEHILAAADELPSSVLITTLHRSLVNKIQDQITHHRYYFLIPEKKWFHIHRLFYLALKTKAFLFNVTDDVYFPNNKLTILNLYCYLLLLSCAELNHFESDDIETISGLLKEWCTLVTISKLPVPDNKTQLMVGMATGSTPHFSTLFSLQKATMPCYLQHDELMQRLAGIMLEKANQENKMLTQPAKISAVADKDSSKKTASLPNVVDKIPLSSEKIGLLMAAWNGYLYQQSAPDQADIPVELCVGFNDIYFYLTGAKTLDEFLGGKSSISVVYDDEEQKKQNEKKWRANLLTTLAKEKNESVDFRKTPSEFNFQPHFKTVNIQQYDATHPRWFATMNEITPRNCTITWEASKASELELGQLIGLRRGPNDHWQVGEVDSKIKLSSKKIKIGVRIISTQAIPVGIDLPVNENQNYCEAILTPPEEILDSPVSIISPPRHYKTGGFVSVAQKNIEEKVQLARLIKMNTYYERCECAFMIKKSASADHR